ncbi:MAG: HAD-IA family hydrolase [Draconibacterium sp.]|nr:HAD-IA family hydrolase [Draconibacterium sp.]
MKNYSAYLFDLDGTLVDSEKLKGKALAETCKLFGGSVEASIYKEVMGESWFHVTNHFFKVAKIEPKFDKFNTEFKSIYQELLRSELDPNPNIVELLTKLKAKGKRLGVVSSAAPWMVSQILTQLKLAEFFEIVITNEQVTKQKPDPEAYLLALKMLSLPAFDVLVFEDSNAGLLAAKNANCDSIAFRHEFNVNNDFSLAIRVISDFREVQV